MSSAATEIELVTDSWPSGLKSRHYWGTVAVTACVRRRAARDWRRDLLRVRRKLRQEARRFSGRKATHVIGVQVSVDPFATGGAAFFAEGVVAWMEKL